MRKLILFLAVLGSIVASANAPASAAPALQPMRSVAGLLDQGGVVETVQYGNYERRREFLRRQEFRRRQAIRRQDFRRRQAVRRGYYNRY